MSEIDSFESAVQELIEQNQRRNDTGRAFARESIGTYVDLLDDLFFYYGEHVRAAERGTQEG